MVYNRNFNFITVGPFSLEDGTIGEQKEYTVNVSVCDTVFEI